MIKEAVIVKPARLKGSPHTTRFIPPNSRDQLIEVDLGFKINPIYKQDKLCYFLPENIYYQKLNIADGKMNAIRDEERTIIITGHIEQKDPINFLVEIFPRLPVQSNIDKNEILLPFYPELNTEIVIRDKSDVNTFYHFICTKIIHKTSMPSLLQLRCLNSYYHANLSIIFRKWHPSDITDLHNIPLL
jgi:hypothetical protein